MDDGVRAPKAHCGNSRKQIALRRPVTWTIKRCRRSGFAWSRGHSDGAVSRDVVLAHLTDIVAATDLPVNADFEGGFALDAAGVAESVRLAVATGVAGLSIEDSTGDPAKPLHEISV